MYALGLCGTQRLLRLYRTVSRHARSARVLAPLTHTLNEYTATTAVCVPCRSLGYYTHTDCTACARGRANTIPSSHLSPSFTHIMLDARTLRRTKHHPRSICVVLRVLTYGSSSYIYIYLPLCSHWQFTTIVHSELRHKSHILLGYDGAEQFATDTKVKQ